MWAELVEARRQPFDKLSAHSFDKLRAHHSYVG
jgi:hypothetical protein